MASKCFLLALLLFPLLGRGQNNGCIDSVSFNQFYPSTFNTPLSVGAGFYFTPQRDVFDNLYTSGASGSGFNNSYWSIIKFDVNNKLVWYKNYKTDLFLTFKGGGNVYDIEPKGNLIFADNLVNPANPVSNWLLVSKTDSAGNFLWSRTIKHGTNPNVTGELSLPKTNNNGELFALGRYLDNSEEPVVVALDATGNLKWSKRYKYITVPKFHLLGSSITVENNNSIAVAIQYYYDADIITDPAAKFGFQILKINTTDGSIAQQTSVMYYDDVTGNIPHKSTLQKINYDSVRKCFLLFSDAGNNGRDCVFSLFDENLNHLKTKLISTFSVPFGGTKISVSKKNEITFIDDTQGPIQSFHFATVDNQLNLGPQKYVDLASLGFPQRNFEVDLSYKKNGMLSFQVGTYGSSFSEYFYVYDQSPFYNSINACVGKDSLVYTELPVYLYPVANPLIEDAGIVPLTITNNFPDFPPVDFPFPKNEICKEISICDTIKLFGTQYHCLSNSIDSFKIIRNPLCKRITNWQVDTAYIKILNQNDTALYVEYRQPYRGKIKVSFGGCSLTDSIAIEVYAAQTGVNLGNDTMHCPGKTITLRAGKNFKTYQWQDGSSRDSLVAIQPGQYHVTATDSCGNIFNDTLVINPFDVVLKTDHPQALCPGDTATFILPNQLINYSWLPTTNSSLSGFTWRLFPSGTTTYSISGQRLPGCTVSDTVLINVRPNCLPDYMYFPTAFTPDNNGLNETYKPGFNGQLALYEFIIYNRYGQPVFKTTDATKGWDGRFKNSKPLTGSYVWSCKYQFVGRPVQQEQGTFILIR
jgi:gliding motility-associated-like protein